LKTRLIILLAILGLASCRKSDRDFDESLLATQDATDVKLYLLNNFYIVDDVAKKEYGMTPGTTSGLTSCATIISNTLGSPNTFNIDFGGGCTGADGRVRKGQMYVTVDGTYGDSLCKIEVNFLDFFINDVEIEGKIKYTHNGMNADNLEHYLYSYTDLKLRYTNPDKVATISGSGKKILYSDRDAFDVSDDVYKLTGSSEGRSISGNWFESVITSPLIFDHSCHYINSGLMETTPANLVPRFADFGDGTCDSAIVVTISQTQHLVTAP